MTNLKTLLDENVNGATFIAIDTITEPKLKGGKRNPFQGRVRKVMMGASVMVFQNKKSHGYDNMVKRRLVKEGKNPESFNLSPRAWGVRLSNTPIVEHKGQHYLEVIFLKSGEVHYEVDGVKTEPANIDGLNLIKEEGQQGGLNDKVIIRTFKVANIANITINKNTYSKLEYK